jgi:hypothetical protein
MHGTFSNVENTLGRAGAKMKNRMKQLIERHGEGIWLFLPNAPKM